MLVPTTPKPIATPGEAVWRQRHFLARKRERVEALGDLLNAEANMKLYQWAQLMAFALEFQPDLILEMGRGAGNSTCAFTEVAHELGADRCRVVSLCLGPDWAVQPPKGLVEMVGKDWFKPLTTLQGDMRQWNPDPVLRSASRVLVFWDAHGWDVAEWFLAVVMPRIADRAHAVAMHDMTDARYHDRSFSEYRGQRLWRGTEMGGSRVILGHIDSAVAQSIAALDFTSRNQVPLESSDHSLHEVFADPARQQEALGLMGDRLFVMQGHWFWFSLNHRPGPYTFPHWDPNPRRASPIQRLHFAAQMLLFGYTREYF